MAIQSLRPNISRYDAWHGMGAALAGATVASSGGAGVYIHLLILQPFNSGLPPPP